MIVFLVQWSCACGCNEDHRLYLETLEEAQALVVELQRRNKALEIQAWRWSLPRRKSAVVAALNDAAGRDVEVLGEVEEICHLKRNDQIQPGEAETYH